MDASACIEYGSYQMHGGKRYRICIVLQQDKASNCEKFALSAKIQLSF